MSALTADGMKWTPGPWKLRPYGHAWGVSNADGSVNIVMDGLGGDDECGIHGSTDKEALANARLIEAAPDLYEALKAAHRLIAEAAMTGFNYADGDWTERLFLSQGPSFAALRKADGRT